jgi:hypothetical protein
MYVTDACSRRGYCHGSCKGAAVSGEGAGYRIVHSPIEYSRPAEEHQKEYQKLRQRVKARHFFHQSIDQHG